MVVLSGRERYEAQFRPLVEEAGLLQCTFGMPKCLFQCPKCHNCPNHSILFHRSRQNIPYASCKVSASFRSMRQHQTLRHALIDTSSVNPVIVLTRPLELIPLTIDKKTLKSL